MEQKYISIKEYAERKGVTKQAVYKQLNNKLSKYVEMVDGKKMLKIEVLELEEVNKVDQQSINYMTTEIERLKAEVERLQAENKEHVDFIKEQSKKLADLTEQSHILLQHNQLLLAEKEQKEDADPLHEAEPIPDQEEKTPEEEKTDTRKKRRGLFSRIRK